ncbi:MalY/PatB family protein [Mycetocola reblochoni]|uniref:cysteine-S-conjugate beta-lyase n=2 Tax=Mycetocola reblochoni TaxID=331618 RepID=A0A1R4J551_9MICO|nr:aminotransferase class I/II-fold pyridoxal phosphate-dependent enzyme [Mycetocola reblochoni]RLP69565.1 aminotransferase class I/II-fold pyridoxal phosphate-dependent enzyme [Mycetocola reblochoni]SJN27220.1 probable aminotransferase [Mycetocola reblochoni REB411]
MDDCSIFLTEAQARERTSSKWRAFPADVIPLHVAELDVELAPPIRTALHAAVELGDTGGYHGPSNPVRAAFAGFAQRHWAWAVDADDVTATTDVSVAIVETLRRILPEGGRVVITPPVYAPFVDLIVEAGSTPVHVPLVERDGALRLDIDGIDAAFADGASVFLLCHPHNPTGVVHTATELAALSAVVERHDGWVVSDEIHAPLTHPGVVFPPYPSVSPAAREHGIALHAGSKGFNIPGLKCALIVTQSERTRAVALGLPQEVVWRTSQFGAIATSAAFASGDAWLTEIRAAVRRNCLLLGELLAEHLPEAQYRTPEAGYLAWVDLGAERWGSDPAERILDEGRVAVGHGPTFGEGEGCIRLNLGCHPDTIRVVVERLASLRPGAAERV